MALDGLVAHFLIGGIGEGHGRRHGDGVAGMDAHGVEVFDRTDDDDVVVGVAEQFEFELFPAEHGFFYQHLVGGRKVEAAAQGFVEFFFLVDKAAAGAAQGVGGADDEGKPIFCAASLPSRNELAM
jgi:hypothetical protein